MADPRAALAALVAAFERHLEASAQRRGDDDPSVVAAYDDLADAFESYDDALLEAYGEMTPLDVYGSGEEDDDVDDGDIESDGDVDEVYLGLDDDEFDDEDLSGDEDDGSDDDEDGSDDEDDGSDDDDDDDDDEGSEEDLEDSEADEESAAHPS